MFQIGDNIVYPMQGAGVVEAIEEKEILGEKQQYYVIKMPLNKMQIMIPAGRIKGSNIRKAVDTLTLEKVWAVFKDGESDSSLSYKQRFKINMDKMKTGDIQENAEVIRDLMSMKKKKALNSSEKTMLGNARKFFISEMGLVKGLTETQATNLLDYRIGG